MFKISYENDDIVIRIRNSEIDNETLMEFLDYIELESIKKRSRLTEEESFYLSKEIDQSVWAKVKERYFGVH